MTKLEKAAIDVVYGWMGGVFGDNPVAISLLEKLRRALAEESEAFRQG